MKLLTIILSVVLTTSSFGQSKDLSSLPAYDCSLKKVMAIIGRQTIVTTPDNSTGLEQILVDYCSILGNNCIRKKESELSTGDQAKDILAVGVLSEFKNWSALKTPVRLTKKGFIINNMAFTGHADGFVFVDTNRIVISGNSLRAVKDAQLALTGGHDILVVQGGKITYFGNRLNGSSFNWFNLQKLKQTNYFQKRSELFSAIYVSKTFKDSINYPELYKALRAYVQQFLGIYKLKMPKNKVSWFIHSNMQEYGTMSGMFGLTCPGNNSAGFSIRGEIHTNGFNTGLLKHEYSHFLFDNTIPQDNDPAFFVEGSVEYVTNLNNKDLLNKRIGIAKKFRDSLNYTDLIINNKDFYGQYSDANYSVCGVFVKFIMENYGVEAYKKYCLTSNKSDATKEIFNTDFGSLVNKYKTWLDSQ